MLVCCEQFANYGELICRLKKLRSNALTGRNYFRKVTLKLAELRRIHCLAKARSLSH